MEDINIYGARTNDVPNATTIKTLEKIKKYLLKKLQSSDVKDIYTIFLVKEIRALEKAMNFIKWINNNLSNDMVKEIIRQYEMKDNGNIDEETEKYKNKNDGN